MSDGSDWSVQLSPSAGHAIERLPHKVAAAVVEFITATLPENPRRLSKPLRFELAGWRVARRGDYRVTLRLDDDTHLIYVGRVDHRSHAYRRR